MKLKLTSPYADELPPLAGDEFEALRASIESEGVRDPVLTTEDGRVLDGHHRLKIEPDAPVRVVPGSRDWTDAECRAFVHSTNNMRRNLSPAQKSEQRGKQKRIARELKQLGRSQEEIAQLLGVKRRTVGDWLEIRTIGGPAKGSNTLPDCRVKIPSSHHPVIFDRVSGGDSQAQVAADCGVSQKQISNIIRRLTTMEERRSQLIEIGSQDGDEVVRQGDFREVLADISDGSIDLILTDPPYLEQDVPIYGDLGELASRVLKPGGLCLAYVGLMFLPDALSLLHKHLDYVWTFSVRHSGGYSRMYSRHMMNTWKGIVAFARPPFKAWWEWMEDTVSGGREKGLHEWQQAQVESEYLIDRLTLPGSSIVLDPMCGSGTVLAAAVKLGRQALGSELEPGTALVARGRVSEASKTRQTSS
jgi:transcriptional regulator with XRE-family HTH domain